LNDSSPSSCDGAAVAPAPDAPKTTAQKKRVILPYVLLLIVLATFFSGSLFFLSLFLPASFTGEKTILVPRGSSAREIAKILDETEVLIHPLLFRLTSRLMAKDRLKAGEYAIKEGLNVLDITLLLREGKTVVRTLTIPEGLTSHDIVSLIQSSPALSGSIKDIPPEGSLWPETYRYSHGDSREGILARMRSDADTALAELWNRRYADLPFKTVAEALILASIVEKETGKKPEERPLVAGVFINRLRLRMPLQSDPTVIYALTGGAGSLGRSLTRADWMTPSPYNTYVNTGLPPSPICNPGRAAVEAVLHPNSSGFLYFVADGTGGHVFSSTLADHNKNVAAWRRLNRP